METPTTNKNKSSKENWKKAAAMAGAAMAGAGAVAAVDVLRENEEAEDVKPTTEEQTATQQAHDPSTEDAAGPTSNAHTQSAAAHQAPHHHQGANHHQAPQHQDAQAQTAQAQQQATPEQQAQPEQHPTTPEDETATQNVAQHQPTGTAAADHVEVIDVQETPDIDPSLVAQDLTNDAADDILVTPNDLEAEHIDLAATDTIETVDGETIQATPIADDSAEPVYMVDINTGDNTPTDDLVCAPDPADDLMGTNDPADADLYLSPSDDAFIS